MFKGAYTALITPFKNGKVDYDAFQKLIERQISAGIDGIVPVGTTGESPTLSHDEHNEVVRKAVQFANKRVKVVAGTGSNSTDEAVYLSKEAEKAGADGVLVVNPYYNKPPQRALIEHFAEIAKSISIPVMLYNIPGRTGVNFEPESVLKVMDKAPNIKGMKEASGDINQMMKLIELAGDRLAVLSGDDNMLLPLMSVGGLGIVSVISNLLPESVVKIVRLFEKGDIEGSKKEFYRILPICRLMFIETNPIPIKAIMAKSGYCQNEIRMPLMNLPEDKVSLIVDALKKIGVNV